MPGMTRLERLRQTRAATPPAPPIAEQLPAKPRRLKSKSPVARAEQLATSAIGAHQETSVIRSAPLRLFDLSELNVRKTYDRASIHELADDIATRGMKQNLVAIEGVGGMLLVVAGGRRLRAWWHLRDTDRATPDEEIAYLLEDQATARETSLAENVQKESLNPADEAEAYAAIVADHQADADPIAVCARRFAKPRRYIEQRLRLADLAIEILDALRDGRIDLDAAMAYATFGDHEAQLLVFFQEERRTIGVQHSARNIRETMRGRSTPAESAPARYVGLDAYVAAGGRVDRELFMGVDEGEKLLDPAILDDLVRKKATAELSARAAADGLASGMLVQGFVAHPAWPRPPATHIQRRGVHPDQLDADLRATAIGVYNLVAIDDEVGLQLDGVMTAIAMPSPARESASIAPSLPPPAPAGDASIDIPVFRSPPREESAAQAIARFRVDGVQRRAAVMAAHAIATASLIGDRLVIPGPDDAFEPVEIAPDGDVLVTIQVKVHPDELEAMRATAEAAYDEAAA